MKIALIPGKQLARKSGYPTLNFACSEIISGAFLCKVKLTNKGVVYKRKALISFVPRKGCSICEAHVFDWNDNISDFKIVDFKNRVLVREGLPDQQNGLISLISDIAKAKTMI